MGYGCTTCIGNSGPLNQEISDAINRADLVACSVLSGNRNFEGRINPDVKANYLMSPPLVVAYAVAGNMGVDLTKDPLAKDKDGNDVFLKDIWPSNEEVQEVLNKSLTSKMFKDRYADVFEGDEYWQAVETSEGEKYAWDEKSTYIRNPSFFDNIADGTIDSFEVKDARIFTSWVTLLRLTISLLQEELRKMVQQANI